MREQLGRSAAGDLTVAERREWLVTNGIGGFACGTVAGMLTRRYHGLLVAASEPPLGRTLLVAKFDEIVRYAGATYALGANRWADGTVSARGFELLDAFFLDGSTPVWRFALGDALVEKRIWMEHGANTTYVRYTHVRGRMAAAFEVRSFVNDRDSHATSFGAATTADAGGVGDGGVRVTVRDGGSPIFLSAAGATCSIDGAWYREFRLERETERGLEDRDDHVSACVFAFGLAPGESLTVVASDRAGAEAGGAAERARARDASLRAAYAKVHAAEHVAPPWIHRLVLAADQFVVARPASGEEGTTVVAGYPWFGDWGRDTMIALPGLLLATGRAGTARKILATFAGLVDRGMLPNALPERGAPLSYNTADAALWFVEAVAAYRDATGDVRFAAAVFSMLEAIVDGYVHGTRYGIRVDRDGLVHAGEAGSQVTWMDARVGGVSVTPRVGKPVEICALWYNALRRIAGLARDVGRTSARFDELAETARTGFERFWNAEKSELYDVVDGPFGDDARSRPNQLFAVSLRHSPLETRRQRAVVTACASKLYLPAGMRSLDPADPGYIARYGGGPEERDAAYHQGTGWIWLLGPFVSAHYRAFGDADAARAYLAPIADYLRAGAFGTLAELCQPEPPFAPDGAFAQAWSVGEILRAWHEARPA